MLTMGGGPRPKDVMRFDLYTDELVDKLVAPEMPKAFMPFLEGPASSYFKTLESVLTGKPYKIRTLIAKGRMMQEIVVDSAVVIDPRNKNSA